MYWMEKDYTPIELDEADWEKIMVELNVPREFYEDTRSAVELALMWLPIASTPTKLIIPDRSL